MERMQSMKPSKGRLDRYSVHQCVRFSVKNRYGVPFHGSGYSVNLSGSGILFRSGVVPLPGEELEMTVDWPVRRANGSKLELILRAHVVRFEGNLVAAAIDKYEFIEQPGQAEG